MDLNKNTKYFLYSRKSSEGEDRQVQSIDDQINALTKLANERGWQIVDVIKESHSAKAPGERRLFNEMLERIEKGEADGILCWQINRLSRNPIDSARVQWMLQNSTIKSIQTIDGERKPDDNAVLMSVEAGVSNQYIIDLRKNIKRGLYSKLEKGWLPALAPQGYLNEPYDRTIVPDEERFLLMRKMWDLMLTGNHRPSQILDIANNEWGYRTRKTRKCGDKPMSLSEIYRIFHNKFYFGIIQYSGNEYEGKHKPMIREDEFWRVQDILGKKGVPRPKSKDFAFTGLMTCEECGCSITAETKRMIRKLKTELRFMKYSRNR